MRRGRVCIIHQGDIYNERKLEREALRRATFDAKADIPTQAWYDSLRETDDGRFSLAAVNDETQKLKDQLRKQNRYFGKIFQGTSTFGANTERRRYDATEVLKEVPNEEEETISYSEMKGPKNLLLNSAATQVLRPFNST